MDRQRAQEITDGIFEQALRAMEGAEGIDASLEVTKSKTYRCYDAPDGGSDKRVKLTTKVDVNGVPLDRSRDMVHKVYEAWRESGHTPESPPDPGAGYLSVNMRSNPDKFFMSATSSKGGYMSMGVTTTCFWPEDEAAEDSAAQQLPDRDELGDPPPQTEEELQLRERLIARTAETSTMVQEHFSGGYVSGPAPQITVLRSGACLAVHQWQYTCGTPDAAADAVEALRTALDPTVWRPAAWGPEDFPNAEEWQEFQRERAGTETLEMHKQGRRDAGFAVVRSLDDATVNVSVVWRDTAADI